METRPHCILHIGCPKTGTTSLQQFFTDNRDCLLRRGVLYPRSLLERPGELLHTALATYALEESRPRLRGELFAAQRRQRSRLLRERLQAAFAEEMEPLAGQIKTLVLSNEHLELILQTELELARLKDLLAPHCSRITVVVYLRRQDRLATSLYSTALRAGRGELRMLPPHPARMPRRRMFEYHQVLCLWSRVFGRENLQIRLYEECRHALIEDFCKISGVPLGPEMKVSAPVNTAISSLGQAMLSRINQSRLFTESKRLTLVEVFNRNYAGRPSRPARAEAIAFYDHWRTSNEQVRQDFLPHRPTPLFDEDFSEYPLTVEAVVPTFDDALELILGLLDAGGAHAGPEEYRITSNGSSKRVQTSGGHPLQPAFASRKSNPPDGA